MKNMNIDNNTQNTTTNTRAKRASKQGGLEIDYDAYVESIKAIPSLRKFELLQWETFKDPTTGASVEIITGKTEIDRLAEHIRQLDARFIRDDFRAGIKSIVLCEVINDKIPGAEKSATDKRARADKLCSDLQYQNHLALTGRGDEIKKVIDYDDVQKAERDAQKAEERLSFLKYFRDSNGDLFEKCRVAVDALRHTGREKQINMLIAYYTGDPRYTFGHDTIGRIVTASNDYATSKRYSDCVDAGGDQSFREELMRRVTECWKDYDYQSTGDGDPFKTWATKLSGKEKRVVADTLGRIEIAEKDGRIRFTDGNVKKLGVVLLMLLIMKRQGEKFVLERTITASNDAITE